MKEPSPEQMVVGDKSGIDLSESRPSLQAQLREHEARLKALPDDCPPLERGRVQLDIAETRLALLNKKEAWDTARELFDVFVEQQAWQDAIETCDVLFQSEQPESLTALGNGVWLSITYPVPAQLTIAMLQHIIDETPDDSDGAAVAAMAANYIADMRTEGEEKESLTFFTRQILAGVARRHRGIEDDPEMIKMWIEILELNDVQELFSRLAAMLDIIVDGKWWIDRDALRARLPAN
jgi:hypothetical protein